MPTVVRYNSETAFRLVAAATIAEGQMVAASGVLADADTAAGPLFAVGFAIRGAASGETFGVAQQGEVHGYSSLTIGARQWLSGTAGGITETRPTTAGDAVQALGIAIATTKVVYNIVPAQVLAQAAGNSTVT